LQKNLSKFKIAKKLFYKKYLKAGPISERSPTNAGKGIGQAARAQSPRQKEVVVNERLAKGLGGIFSRNVYLFVSGKFILFIFLFF
jgi:hypothetical protein